MAEQTHHLHLDHAQADAIAALMAQVRADAQAAQGIRPRDRHGRYTSRDGKR